MPITWWSWFESSFGTVPCHFQIFDSSLSSGEIIFLYEWERIWYDQTKWGKIPELMSRNCLCSCRLRIAYRSSLEGTTTVEKCHHQETATNRKSFHIEYDYKSKKLLFFMERSMPYLSVTDENHNSCQKYDTRPHSTHSESTIFSSLCEEIS